MVPFKEEDLIGQLKILDKLREERQLMAVKLR